MHNPGGGGELQREKQHAILPHDAVAHYRTSIVRCPLDTCFEFMISISVYFLCMAVKHQEFFSKANLQVMMPKYM